MFWNNYVKLCDTIGKKPNVVASELGFSSGSVSAWKQGRLPRGGTIQMIADYFGVDSNYLLNDNNRELDTQNHAQSSPDPLPPDIAELAEICEQLQRSKAGAARLQFLLEEAQRMLEETKAYEKKLAESQQNAVNP